MTIVATEKMVVAVHCYCYTEEDMKGRERRRKCNEERGRRVGENAQFGFD